MCNKEQQYKQKQKEENRSRKEAEKSNAKLKNEMHEKTLTQRGECHLGSCLISCAARCRFHHHCASRRRNRAASRAGEGSQKARIGRCCCCAIKECNMIKIRIKIGTEHISSNEVLVWSIDLPNAIEHVEHAGPCALGPMPNLR